AYQARVTLNLPFSTSPIAAKIPVPAGKRLDIERVTMVGTVLPAQSSQQEVFTAVLTTTVSGRRGDYPIPPPTTIPFPTGLQPLHLLENFEMFGAHADGGTDSPTITIDRTDLGTIGQISVTLSGRLE